MVHGTDIERVRPLGDRILVEPENPECSKYAGLLWRPERRQFTGRVVAIGSRVNKVAVGNLIVYPHHTSLEKCSSALDRTGKAEHLYADAYIMRESDVMAIVDE